MTSYKIIWESLSPYSTALMSDTIFGHFAWAVRYLKGASLLQELISELRQKPSLVFSSAFPSGKLPLPCLPYPNDLKDRFPQWTQHRKKLKALEYLETEEFCTPGWKFCWLDFFTKSLTGLPAPSAQPKQDLVFHNSIDRLSGTTSAGGGNLYAAETTFVPDGYIWDSYLRIDTSFLTVEDIKAIFAYISETGFGKDKSTGKGRFRITLTEYSFPLPEKANAWLNLSHMVPAAADPTHAYYSGFTKFGKLGGNFAVLESPFKYPIFILQPGAVFIGKQPVGSVLTDIHPLSEKEGIIQNLYSYSIPFTQVEV